jgi:hypothetical protein
MGSLSLLFLLYAMLFFLFGVDTHQLESHEQYIWIISEVSKSFGHSCTMNQLYISVASVA